MKKNKKNYRYWRAIQRAQLGLSANIYMIFSSAALGFVLNLIIGNKGNLGCAEKTLAQTGCCFLLISLIFYGFFTHNRLKDFRKTAKLTKMNKTEDEISEKTKRNGKRTWLFYDLQRLFLAIGLIISITNISIYINS